MTKAIVTSKGQVTIPKLIREKSKIVTGAQLDFHLEDDGTIIITPLTRDIADLEGIIKLKGKKPLSSKQMKDAIWTGIKGKIK